MAAPEQDVTDDLIGALQDPALFDHPVERFRVIETHISRVLLTGNYAYKIKKPVNLGFLDFSTLEKRKFFCDEELRLNRRFAPELYLDVVAIRGSRGQPRLTGNGKVIEYAVRMREFSQHGLLSRCATEHRLEPAHIDAMAGIIADFHALAERAAAATAFGSYETFRKWSAENFEHIEASLPERLLPDGFAELKEWCLSPGDTHRDAINGRRAAGCIRECHGDLHLGNMAFIDERITLFDCIEFNEELRWIDTLSESAFLAMDLHARGYPRYAWRFLNRYLQACGDYAGLAVLRHYLVYRALVRAKVEALRVRQHAHPASEDSAAYRDVSTYLELAGTYSKDHRPALIIMHGFSGSGKSSVARQLVEALGAIQVRSDIERKRLYGLQPGAASSSAIGQGIYTPKASERTYDRLANLANIIMGSGYTAIVDASFLGFAERDLFRQLAREKHVPLALVSCDAPAADLRKRIRQRSEQGFDPSEATLEVLQQQMASHDPLRDEELEQALVLSGSTSTLQMDDLNTLEQMIASSADSGNLQEDAS